MPQVPFNNTYIYDHNGLCSTDTADFCTTYRGGQYIESASSSHVAQSNPILAGADPFDTVVDQHTTIWANDDLVLASNTSLTGFPLGILRTEWGEQYQSQMSIGLGPNSTVLTALKAAGRIGSRTWSMFWGLAGATASAQMDGTFVFGGFDSAKVSGSNHTKALGLTTSCPSGIFVTVTDIQLNFPNGSNPSLFKGVRSIAMVACIIPDWPTLITLPTTPYWDLFESLTGTNALDNSGTPYRSVGVNFWGLLYPPGKVLTIRIPNSQFVLPDMTITSSGQIALNESVREVDIITMEGVGANDLPVLGRQFLTSAYLMVNQDASMFTLWKANPTVNEVLVAVDVGNNPVSTLCAKTHTNTTAAPSTNATTAHSTKVTPAPSTSVTESSSGGASDTSGTVQPSKTKTNIGLIAGVAAGGVAALGLLVGLLLFCLRRRKRRRSAEAAAVPPPPPAYESRPPRAMQEMSGVNEQELYASGGYWEMDASRSLPAPSSNKTWPTGQTNTVHELGSRSP
ncbi:hypothetical protein LTR66_006744 [Elasticomyces elasticus]|nr:hypothetical protein LTR66_006744 [Elasticomyces elasticus]